MGNRVLHVHQCKATFLIKDGSYLSIPSGFATKIIAEVIKEHKDSYVEKNFKKINATAPKDELINIDKMMFDSTFSKYLANKALSEDHHKKNTKYFSKIEDILFNDLEKISQKDTSLTNFSLENTKNLEFENTVSILLSIATKFENNLHIESHYESDQDVTYLLEWKKSFFNKFLLNNSESIKLIFRLSDIKTIKIVNTRDDQNAIYFILKGKTLPFSLTPGFKIRRRNNFS